MKKKEKDKITKWVLDYFCDVIMPTCSINAHEVNTHIDLNPKNEEKTFSVEVNFPYRRIDLYIRPGGVEMYKLGEIKKIRRVLFHEAFHVFLWKYKEYATARYVDATTMSEMEEDMADKFSIIVETLYSKSNEPKTK